jgi:NADH:ubiquinone oxidoreductase subunit 6 (subunit J)
MELWPFLIVAFIAIASAVMMLLSNNAVHSALFLILVMVCIAFLFLLLNAPFLAMIQISVYAGAIMVLFLFVIMLLGAEQLPAEQNRFPWFGPLALFLAVTFLLTAGFAIVRGQIDLSPKPFGDPMLRVAHLAPDAGPVDVYANSELVVSDVEFSDVTDYLTLEPGEYNIALFNAGTQNAVLAQTVTLEDGDVQTALAYGEGTTPQVNLLQDDLSTPSTQMGRLTFINADTSAPNVQVVDLRDNLQLDLDPRTGEVADPIVISNLELGVPTQPREYDEMTVNWAFIDPANPDTVLFRLRDFEISNDQAQTIVLTEERLFDGSLRALAVPLTAATVASFGGPESIGIPLFTAYLLPFELVSILLLGAMVGAIILAHREIAPVRERLRGRRKVSRPLTSVIAAQTGHDVTEAPALEASSSISPAGQPEAGD